MYVKGTILKLKKQKPNTEGPNKDQPHAYNRVEVLGPSPVIHSERLGPDGTPLYTGADAQGVILQPAGEAFGGVIDEPFGKVRQIFNVEFVPEPVEIEATMRIRVVEQGQAGPTPEQIFEEKAPGAKPKPGEKRARVSPLEDPPPIPKSPLDG